MSRVEIAWMFICVSRDLSDCFDYHVCTTGGETSQENPVNLRGLEIIVVMGSLMHLISPLRLVWI